MIHDLQQYRISFAVTAFVVVGRRVVRNVLIRGRDGWSTREFDDVFRNSIGFPARRDISRVGRGKQNRGARQGKSRRDLIAIKQRNFAHRAGRFIIDRRGECGEIVLRGCGCRTVFRGVAALDRLGIFRCDDRSSRAGLNKQAIHNQRGVCAVESE